MRAAQCQSTLARHIDSENPTGYTQITEERISMRDGSDREYYGYDAHSGVRLLMDGSGTVTDGWDYDAFGSIIARAGSTDNVFTYHAEQMDSWLGLQYLRARWVALVKGRFWTRDTFEGDENYPGSLQPYGYLEQDPTNDTDPSGQVGEELGVSMWLDLALASPTIPALGKSAPKRVEVKKMSYKRAADILVPANVGVDIELGAFVEGRKPMYPAYRWVQLVTTNKPSTTGLKPGVPYNDPQPPDDAKPFYYTDSEEPLHQHTGGYDYVFNDGPRRANTIGRVYWKAKLTLAGVSSMESTAYTDIVTITYGFDIRKGVLSTRPLVIRP